MLIQQFLNSWISPSSSTQLASTLLLFTAILLAKLTSFWVNYLTCWSFFLPSLAVCGLWVISTSTSATRPAPLVGDFSPWSNDVACFSTSTSQPTSAVTLITSWFQISRIISCLTVSVLTFWLITFQCIGLSELAVHYIPEGRFLSGGWKQSIRRTLLLNWPNSLPSQILPRTSTLFWSSTTLVWGLCSITMHHFQEEHSR